MFKLLVGNYREQDMTVEAAITHSDKEQKPCRECRLKLILLGVPPSQIDSVESAEQIQILFEEYSKVTEMDPTVQQSIKQINREDQKCKGICKHFEPQWAIEGGSKVTKSEYSLDAKCNVCGTWINKAKLKSAYEHYDPILQGFNPYDQPGRIKCPCCHRQLKQRNYRK